MGKPIPEFESREDEAAFWDTADLTDYIDQLEEITIERPRKMKSVTFAVRLDPRTVDLLRKIAEKEHTGVTKLVRSWIMDRLQLETKAGFLAETTSSLPIDIERQVRDRILDSILEALPQFSETALKEILQDAEHTGNDMPKRITPANPGEVLLEEFLKPLELSQSRLAKDIAVPARRINEIVHGTRAVSADIALRLARYFGTSEHYWMDLQSQWDLDTESDKIGNRILQEITPRAS